MRVNARSGGGIKSDQLSTERFEAFRVIQGRRERLDEG
jgi:hypothetical protein